MLFIGSPALNQSVLRSSQEANIPVFVSFFFEFLFFFEFPCVPRIGGPVVIFLMISACGFLINFSICRDQYGTLDLKEKGDTTYHKSKIERTV